VIEKLFDRFGEALQNAGIQANEGKMIDASFVEVPRQRNTREENILFFVLDLLSLSCLSKNKLSF